MKDERTERDEKIKREKAMLIQEVCKLQEEMAVTLNHFSDVLEPELVDYYTYCYKASQIRHGYLLKQLKKIYYTPNL